MSTLADFYRENNGRIDQAAINLFHEGRPIDNIAMGAELERSGVLDHVGGRAHLALLQDAVPTAANVEHYARIVKEKAQKLGLPGGRPTPASPAWPADLAAHMSPSAITNQCVAGALATWAPDARRRSPPDPPAAAPSTSSAWRCLRAFRSADSRRRGRWSSTAARTGCSGTPPPWSPSGLGATRSSSGLRRPQPRVGVALGDVRPAVDLVTGSALVGL